MLTQDICYRKQVISVRGVYERYEAGCEDAGLCTAGMLQRDVCHWSNNLFTCQTCRSRSKFDQCTNVSGRTPQPTRITHLLQLRQLTISHTIMLPGVFSTKVNGIITVDVVLPDEKKNSSLALHPHGNTFLLPSCGYRFFTSSVVVFLSFSVFSFCVFCIYVSCFLH